MIGHADILSSLMANCRGVMYVEKNPFPSEVGARWVHRAIGADPMREEIKQKMDKQIVTLRDTPARLQALQVDMEAESQRLDDLITSLSYTRSKP